jgi:NSS family neurotransmitter:Na+ symporter
VLAAAGSAIGLGNIWKFPYITYANEGGTFVIVYLLAVVLIGGPIMMAEIVIGRRTQQSPVGAFVELAKNVAGGKVWAIVGWLGVIAGFVILSYYSVVAGWTVYYVGQCLSWSLGGFSPDDAANLGTNFSAFLASGGKQVGFHSFFMLATMGTVAFGIKGGIERVTKLLMPVLFAILFMLVVASFWAPGFGDAMHFLFHVSDAGADTILEAIGQAFFSLSLGMGAMITYGSYLSRQDSVPRAAAMVCILDTMIAFMACIIMFSIIFGVPEAERSATFSQSSTILFTTLPRLFYELPGGTFLSPVFYLLVAMAALTSTISLLEVVVAYFIDRLGFQRRLATLVVGGLIFALGVPTALSFGASDLLTQMFPIGSGAGFMNLFDYLATNWLLPVGGLLIAVFVGWFVKGEVTRAELEEGHGAFRNMHRLWQSALRFLVPIAVTWVLIAVIGGKTFN